MVTNTSITIRSTFSANLRNGVLCVVDRFDGHTMSVTNDAENVVEFLLMVHGNYPILYEDTDGRIDQLCHDGKEFTGFGNVGATDWDTALVVFKMKHG